MHHNNSLAEKNEGKYRDNKHRKKIERAVRYTNIRKIGITHTHEELLLWLVISLHPDLEGPLDNRCSDVSEELFPLSWFHFCIITQWVHT